MDEELLPIGRFARLARLSVKQLRRYDELGLLRPERVDEATGYRYYRAAQARQALSIGLLRSLDVPLAVVGEVLSGSAGALEGVRGALEEELARRRRTLGVLERVMAEGLPETAVRVVEEEPLRLLLARERAAGMEDVGRATSAAVAKLLAGPAMAGPVRGPARGPVRLVGLFPLDVAEAMEVAVGLAVDELQSGAVVLPGGRFACATHVGAYEQMSLTVHGLLAWCAERGQAVRGPVREVYVSDPAVTAPGELVTEVLVPLDDPARE